MWHAGFASDFNGWTALLAAPLGLAFLLSFLRWLLSPPTWRDGEGPLINEGERVAVKFSWLRWLGDLFTGKFWRW